jgi:hypothetical protein
MKTLKLALFATLVAFAMASVASADGVNNLPKPVKVMNISLEQAMHYPGLVAAMYVQIDKKSFLHNPSLIYTAEVTYSGILFRISGTREEWLRFFNMKIVQPTYGQDKTIGDN